MLLPRHQSNKIESVSEAAVTIPCGLLAILWWYPAIRKGRRTQDAA